MAKELPYFKFNVAEFLLGGISNETDAVIGMFYKACAHYWHKDCALTRDELVKKLGAKRVELLISRGYIKFIHNEFIIIEFLDEQFSELSKTHKVNREKGLKGAEKKYGKKFSPSTSTTIAEVKHLDIDIDKIRKDKEQDKSDLIEVYFKDLENSMDFENIARILKIEKEFLSTFIPGFRLKAELKYPNFDRFTSHFKNYVLKEITNATKPTNYQKGDRFSKQESVDELEELSRAVLRANDGTNG